MKIQVAKQLLPSGSSFWAMGGKTTHAVAPGATISDRPYIGPGFLGH